MKISASIMCFNEEENIPRLMKSLEGIDDIAVIDHGSTDNSVELFRLLGAKVIVNPIPENKPTKKDIVDFEKVFGYKPEFTIKDRIDHINYNEGLVYTKNDWVFAPDCDEIVTWDLEEIKKLLPKTDQIKHRFIHTHNLDGSPASEITISKLFNKKKCRWVGKIHQVVSGTGNSIFTDKMKIDHYQKPKTARGNYLKRMEYFVFKDRDARTIFYLGREYWYDKQYQKGIDMLDRYLKVATWLPEIAEAHYFKALCLWHSFKGDLARESCLKALNINPYMRKAIDLMIEMSWEKNRNAWRVMLTQADNRDVVFP